MARFWRTRGVRNPSASSQPSCSSDIASTVVPKTLLRPICLASYGARPSNMVPKWQRTTSRKLACRVVEYCGPGGWATFYGVLKTPVGELFIFCSKMLGGSFPLSSKGHSSLSGSPELRFSRRSETPRLRRKWPLSWRAWQRPTASTAGSSTSRVLW